MRPTLVKLAVFAGVSLLLFVGLFQMMTNNPSRDSREWTAQFASVSGLRAGDDVRAAGVKVGRVESIEVVDNRRAEVRFTVGRGVRLFERTQVTLRYQNLLGQRYLALTAPSEDRRGEVRPPGSTIPLVNTSPGFDLTALLNGFEPLFSVLEPAEVNQMARNIVAVLQGESGTVESLLRNTAEATRYLSSRDEVFGRVLANLTPVLENLDDQSVELDGTVVELRRLMTGLARERRTIGSSVDHLADLVDSTSSLLAELRPGLRRDVSTLRDNTGLLARERPRLRRTLERLPVLLGGLGRTMSYGGYLNVYLCNLGVATGGARVWIGGASGPYSGACAR